MPCWFCLAISSVETFLVWIVFSPKQQAKMAAYCVSIFGDMLLDKPLDEFPVSLQIFLLCFFFFFLFQTLKLPWAQSVQIQCSFSLWYFRAQLRVCNLLLNIQFTTMWITHTVSVAFFITHSNINYFKLFFCWQLEEGKSLPSPKALLRKIVIKNKKRPTKREEGTLNKNNSFRW